MQPEPPTFRDSLRTSIRTRLNLKGSERRTVCVSIHLRILPDSKMAIVIPQDADFKCSPTPAAFLLEEAWNENVIVVVENRENLQTKSE